MIQPGKALEIARINLVRQMRDRADLFFVFVLPTIIIVALGLQFGGTSRARLGVVAPSGDPAAASLIDTLTADTTRFDVRRVGDAADLRLQVERGRLEAGVVIPDGFEAALRGAGTANVAYVGTSASLTLGIRAPVDAAVARLGAIATAARIAVGAGVADWDAAQAAATAGYARVPGVEVRVTRVGEPGLFAGFSQFTFGASTQLVLFMFLTSMTAAAALVHTKQLGVSRRMVSTPTSVGTIVAGEALGRLGVALVQAAYIVAVTAIAFGVRWGDPLATAVLIVLFGTVASAVAMLVGAISTNPHQAGSIGVFVSLALGALGGSMIPFETMPQAMQQLARLVPHSWALLGLQALIRDGGGIASVAPNVAVLAGYAVVLMGLASWRFRKAIAG